MGVFRSLGFGEGFVVENAQTVFLVRFDAIHRAGERERSDGEPVFFFHSIFTFNEAPTGAALGGLHGGKVAEAHAHRFGLHENNGCGVAAVVTGHDSIEFFSEVSGDQFFVRAVMRSVLVKILEHAMKESSVVGGSDFALVGIEGLQFFDLREIKTERTFEVVFETGDADGGDGIRFFKMKLPRERRVMDARARG